MLSWRIILGTVFVGTLVGIFWLDWSQELPGKYLFPLAIVLTVLASGELARLFQQRTHPPSPLLVYLSPLFVLLAAGMPIYLPAQETESAFVGEVWSLWALAAVLVAALVWEIATYRHDSEGATARLGLSLLPAVYLGLPMSFLIELRLFDPSWGVLPLASLLIVVKFADIAAFTVGKLAGRRKLAPRLSPGKTIEGILGGILGAAACSWLVLVYLAPRFVEPEQATATAIPAWAALLYGFSLGVAGLVGDLAESMLKRDAGAKDSSAWLPGLGGILDMLDSLLLAAPVALLLWRVCLT